MLKKYSICLLLFIFVMNCSSTKDNETYSSENKLLSPEEMYILAMKSFDNENFEEANTQFARIKKIYPLSNEAVESEVMIGFVSYLRMDYDNIINDYKKIIQKYPSYKNLDYIYYMIAMSYYEQIAHHELDGKFNDLALEEFNQVISRFPNSKFAKDSRQKIILVRSNQAAKHMEIGRFYLKEGKYTAALNRFKIVIDEFAITKFVPEALHRMVETYYEMGMIDESFKTASVLGYNYPDSKWYRYSYNLIKKIDDEDTLIDRLTNVFN